MPSFLKVFFLACLIAGFMGAQALPSGVTSVPSVCGTHEVFVYGTFNCIDRFHFIWFADGDGWKSLMTFVNTTKNPIMVNLNLVRPDGPQDSSIASYIHVYGNVPLFQDNKTLWGTTLDLNANDSGEIELLYPQMCQTISICAAAPDVEQVGSVTVSIAAPDGAALDAQDIRASQLLFTYTPPNIGETKLQIPLGLVKHSSDQPANLEANFTETPPELKGLNTNTNTTSFAIFNMTVAQAILVEILDANGNVLISLPTPVLIPNAVFGRGLAEFFGSALPVKAERDGLIHGRVRFRGMNSGSIAVFIPKLVGQSLSAGLVWRAQ